MVGGSGGGVGRLWIWEYGRLNGHSRLRSAWRKWLEDLVLEGRLDLLPRERGGGVRVSADAGVEGVVSSAGRFWPARLSSTVGVAAKGVCSVLCG